jgi:hypothetical protein
MLVREVTPFAALAFAHSLPGRPVWDLTLKR